jgi:dTDP-glucose 4,6-dehydratase
VEDHCQAIERILLDGKIGETYCIGGNSELSNYELVTRILGLMSDITGTPCTIKENVAFVKDRPGHDRRYAMSIDKITRELQWHPEHSFELGFRSTVAWYVSEQGKTWLKNLRESALEVRLDQGKNLQD